jgi:ribose transport system ATP-binding protein
VNDILESSSASDAAMEVLRIDNVCVEFGGRPALEDMSMSVRRGEIHALIGHNGSGKSTAIKVLAGAVRPTSGSVSVVGRPLSDSDPRASINAGLRFVHQDLRLIDGLNAVDNIGLANGYTRFGVGPINWRQVNQQTSELLESFGFTGDPRASVGRLRPVDRLIVALVRAVGHVESDANLVALDEITAALSEVEVERLLELARNLAGRGLGVIFISHYLDEVLEIADRVTVLRSGRVVGDGLKVKDSNLTSDSLVHLMFGESTLERSETVAELEGSSNDGPMYAFDAVRGVRLRDLRIEVRAGEVLGAYGADGSGREELAEVLVGASGLCEFEATNAKRRRMNLGHARQSGVVLVPRDRSRLGSLPSQSIRENLGLNSPELARHRWFMTRSLERKHARRVLDVAGLGDINLDAPFSSLSGGMQQRALVARALATNPKVLVLDEPSQGVDVAARVEIYRLIHEACTTQSLAAVVVSSDALELSEIASRVLIIRNGHIAATLSGTSITERVIVQSASLVRDELVHPGDPQ